MTDRLQRRRTQIRLAQRAYRQRKETTISGLNQRVTKLESAIEEMNKAFSAFDDKMTTSGILARNPAFARELKRARDRFVELTNSIAVEAGSGEEEEEQEQEPGPSSGTIPARSVRPPGTGSQPGLTVSQIPQSSSHQAVSLFPDYPFNFDPSQPPFYNFSAPVPPVTSSEGGPTLTGTASGTFDEHFEDPSLQEWDPNEAFQQFRVELPEICPALYESLFNSRYPPRPDSERWTVMDPLEAQRDFLHRLAFSPDPGEKGHLIELLRRTISSATCTEQRSCKLATHANQDTRLVCTAGGAASAAPTNPHDVGPSLRSADNLSGMIEGLRLRNLPPGIGPEPVESERSSSGSSSLGYAHTYEHGDLRGSQRFDHRSSSSPRSDPRSPYSERPGSHEGPGGPRFWSH